MSTQISYADESIESVIQKYTQTVFGIALSHTRNRADAEDVFQEVFLAYCSRPRTFGDENHRKAWLIRTAVNCALRTANSSWKRRITLHDEIPDAAAADVFRFESDDQNLVYSALCKLPPKYRIVLHLAYFEEMPAAEIAAALRITPGNVKVRMNRGRNMLREELKGDYFYE